MTGLTWRGIKRGARDLTGIAMAVLPFGLGFGAAAVEAGLHPAQASAMSASVFAGASQYAVLDLWREPVPWVALATAVLAVNARHIVLGATLVDYLEAASPRTRWLALAFLSDANWVSTRQAIARGERDLGHLVGGGLLLWTSWVVGTLIGAFAGEALGDLRRLGIDAVMPAFFACALVDLAREAENRFALVLAGVLTLGLAVIMPVHWAIICGALAAASLGTIIRVGR